MKNKKVMFSLEPDLNQAGYGFDELKDFDDGYKVSPKSRITPFRGPLR